jgi:hypothetical protein
MINFKITNQLLENQLKELSPIQEVTVIDYTMAKQRKIDEIFEVLSIDHDNLIIEATSRASLNAPLMDSVFKKNPNINFIIHGHDNIGLII